MERAARIVLDSPLMVRHVAAFWCVLVLAVAASVAGQGQVGQVAQPVPTGEVQPESSAASGNDAPVVDAVVSRSDDQRARDLYLQGDRRYAEGDYEGAIAAFQSAYALSRRPLLLFNLANAFERAGYPDEAVEALRQYLPHAQRAEHDSIEKRMQNLRARATGPAESESVPEPDPVPDPGLDIRASARSADGVARSSALKTTGWALAIAGGAGVLTGNSSSIRDVA